MGNYRTYTSYRFYLLPAHCSLLPLLLSASCLLLLPLLSPSASCLFCFLLPRTEPLVILQAFPFAPR